MVARGEYIRTPEIRKKNSKSKVGCIVSDTTKEKISRLSKEMWRDPDHKMRMSLMHIGVGNPFFGKHHTQESKDKISSSNKGKLGMKLDKNPNWRGGTSFEPYCNKFNKEFKERVRSFWGYKCGICGKPERENKNRRGGDGGKLDVHHVTYEKDACCNNKTKQYFIPLCVSCHSKTNHNQEYWMKVISNKIDSELNGKCYLKK